MPVARLPAFLVALASVASAVVPIDASAQMAPPVEPIANSAAPTTAASTPQSSASPLEQALTNLAAAVRSTNDDPTTGSRALAAAIVDLRALGLAFAQSEPARRQLIDARLTLARAFLALDNRQAATTTMDATIVGARDQDVPAASFGPSLDALYQQRRAALRAQPHGTLQVVCSKSCRVFLDLAPSTTKPVRLPLGSYPLLVVDNTAESNQWETTVSLTAGAPHIVVEWPPAPSAEPAGPPAKPTPPADTLPAPAKRTTTPTREQTATLAASNHTQIAAPTATRNVLPRWIEVAGLIVGTGLVATGATFIALHHTCPGNRHANPRDCAMVWSTRTGGVAALAGGGVLLTSAMALLGIDLARQDAARRSAAARQ